MRINKFVAGATGLSRRAADRLIQEGRVVLNQHTASLGDTVNDNDAVTFDKQPITLPVKTLTLMLNKPAGYVCSRDGQGSKTVYDLLPSEYHSLKPVGRLDKDSSGLLLLTNDGNLSNQLTHPRYAKTKVYDIELDTALTPADWKTITTTGVQLEDGPSKFQLKPIGRQDHKWRITMQEGRNRQIRRTFATLGYQVMALHREQHGDYELGSLQSGLFKEIPNVL